MFEDDSTQSFEDLEKRLKTPAKSKSVSRFQTPKPPVSINVKSPTPTIKVTNIAPIARFQRPKSPVSIVVKSPTPTIKVPNVAPEISKKPKDEIKIDFEESENTNQIMKTPTKVDLGSFDRYEPESVIGGKLNAVIVLCVKSLLIHI